MSKDNKHNCVLDSTTTEEQLSQMKKLVEEGKGKFQTVVWLMASPKYFSEVLNMDVKSYKACAEGDKWINLNEEETIRVLADEYLPDDKIVTTTTQVFTFID